MDAPGALAALVAALGDLRNPDGGWAYYRGKQSRLEPTCWALLGSGATRDTAALDRWPTVEGLLVDPGTRSANLAFNALAVLVPGASAGRGRVLARLSTVFGEVIPPLAEVRQDPTLRGWPWVAGTFSWVEPTAWCALALKKWRTDAPARARIDEAEAVLRDRRCAGGGWNYGNSAVYGQDLVPHVPPTAVGVLALQDRPADPLVVDAVRVLEQKAPVEGSTTALALATLALASVGRPVATLAAQLADHATTAIEFGNVAAIGMAAYALRCVRDGGPPGAFAVGGSA